MQGNTTAEQTNTADKSAELTVSDAKLRQKLSQSLSDKRVFVTGGTGFIGRAVVRELLETGVREIVCLCRPASYSRFATDSRIVELPGDLMDTSSYASALENSDLVIHLAAATGKASDFEMNEINVDGTARLLQACMAKPDLQFAFVSSIATTYPELENYPYALSKLRAEKLVSASGLDYVIFRPTIVLGEGSPIWRALSGIAALRVVPLIGGGATKIQPIGVDVLARALVKSSVNSGSERVIELGGRDVLTFREFFELVRSVRDMPPAVYVTIPPKPVMLLLQLLKRLLASKSPGSPGQIYPFLYDGVASPNASGTESGSESQTISRLVQDLVLTEKNLRSSGELQRECALFTRYLLGEEASGYVCDKYAEIHQSKFVFEESIDVFDARTLKFAGNSLFGLRIADAYCSLFYRFGSLKKKLVICVAVLENSPGFHSTFTSGARGKRSRLLVSVFLSLMSFASALAAGLLVLGPAHIWSLFTAKRRV